MPGEIAPRDDNHVTTILGTDINTVATTRLPVIIGADSVTHRLLVSATVTSGGTETAQSVSSQASLTTTATVSSQAGQVGGGSFINLNSAPAYIQMFDTTGAVTLGTTVPSFIQPIPANATPANGAGFVFSIYPRINIVNGIKAAATTTATGASTVATGLTGYILYS